MLIQSVVKHCSFSEARDWMVYAGYLDQYDMYRAKGISVSHLITNAYDSSTGNNDIALMKLGQPLKMSGRPLPHPPAQPTPFPLSISVFLLPSLVFS